MWILGLKGLNDEGNEAFLIAWSHFIVLECLISALKRCYSPCVRHALADVRSRCVGKNAFLKIHRSLSSERSKL